MLYATFGTTFLSLTVRQNVAKTVALKAPCRFWNVLLHFKNILSWFLEAVQPW